MSITSTVKKGKPFSSPTVAHFEFEFSFMTLMILRHISNLPHFITSDSRLTTCSDENCVSLSLWFSANPVKR